MAAAQTRTHRAGLSVAAAILSAAASMFIIAQPKTGCKGQGATGLGSKAQVPHSAVVESTPPTVGQPASAAGELTVAPLLGLPERIRRYEDESSPEREMKELVAREEEWEDARDSGVTLWGAEEWTPLTGGKGLRARSAEGKSSLWRRCRRQGL